MYISEVYTAGIPAPDRLDLDLLQLIYTVCFLPSFIPKCINSESIKSNERGLSRDIMEESQFEKRSVDFEVNKCDW